MAREVSLDDALVRLEAAGSERQREEQAKYGIVARKAFGVAVGEVKKLGKQIGRDHDLALALWESGWYEGRLLAAFVGEPERLTIREMNAWAAEFDNWAVVDTVCFHLFDRSKHAWSRVPVWARAKREYSKRAAFALLWSLSLHDKEASDAQFQAGLALVESAADDERRYVKKALDMALRAIGKRNRVLHRAALLSAANLQRGASPGARWIGRHAARELESSAVLKRLEPS